ncbi:arsenical-resistance protein ACR3 [Flagelloscypha sp. PMI_526]|nr:arsenical-resistance protein ACR3 [Flagelloscypha sp. PMI_526]
MLIGVLLGIYVPGIQNAFDTVKFYNVAAPIAIGMIIMMWPALCKIQYEQFPIIFRSRAIYRQLGISLVLNWIIGPFIMLGLAWATLPDLPTYRTGVIFVGLARCIAMVVVWNDLARGNPEYCAILVLINSLMQLVLYSPLAVFFVNVIGRESEVRINYGSVAISVLIYLGIPLVLAIITRYAVWSLKSKEFLTGRFLPLFGPLSLIGLLYTIIVMFAYQGHHIISNIGHVFRVFVPMFLYFLIMWSFTFGTILWLSRRYHGQGYDMAVTQAFTAGSNNFELAIAVAIGVYGVNSDQALAATIGPLVEVPVLLGLTWAALALRRFFGDNSIPPESKDSESDQNEKA